MPLRSHDTVSSKRRIESATAERVAALKDAVERLRFALERDAISLLTAE